VEDEIRPVTDWITAAQGRAKAMQRDESVCFHHQVPMAVHGRRAE